ncbi:hypothetical protein GCM10028808_54680 [Spirosoma migulaei]
MICQHNPSDLLKEYINSRFTAKPVFPTVQARQWETPFSNAELYEIYTALSLIIKQVDPYSRESMIREFEMVDYMPQQIQGFTSRFWREIVDLMTIEDANFVNHHQVILY